MRITASPPWCLSVDPALPFSPFTDLPLPSYLVVLLPKYPQNDPF
jgi:hypothetical protein